MQLNIGKLAPSIPRTWTRRALWRAQPPCSSLPCVKGMSVEGRMLRPPAHKSAPHLLCQIHVSPPLRTPRPKPALTRGKSTRVHATSLRAEPGAPFPLSYRGTYSRSKTDVRGGRKKDSH